MPPVDLAAEVAAALAAGRPVVALESTIVAHGLPWLDNLEIGRALEAEVRAGRAVVGLSPAELEALARGGPAFKKANAADLAVAIARGEDAATTVAGTAHLAAHAGIRLFATG